MKKILPLVIATVFLAMTVAMVLPLAPSAVAQQAENRVGAQFSTHWNYDSPEDTFTNGEVTGKKDWHANMGSRVPLTGLTLTLDSALNFDHIMKENLTTTGPPTYVWSMSPSGTSSDAYVGFGSLDSPGAVPVTFPPGFDASRSADKTEFSAPGTQTLTITVTPRVATEQLAILVFADENGLVNPVITSPTSGDGIELRQEGHQLVISPAGLALNTTWTIDVTIQVTPKVPDIEYLPYVAIGWRESLGSDTASGNSLSLPVADMGTWTWSAEGSYEWQWTDELIRQVSWSPYAGKMGDDSTQTPPLKGNQVQVHFSSQYNVAVEDTFTNAEVTGMPIWSITDIVNTTDETGEPVRGLRVTLDSDLAFNTFFGTDLNLIRRGPPTYEWSFGDKAEEHKHTGWATGPMVGFNAPIAPPTLGKVGPRPVSTPATIVPVTFTPGFDISRSFDKTVFTAPDTQTVTITVTPREERIERVGIYVHVSSKSDLVDAAIISHSGYGGMPAHVTPDGQHSGIEDIPVELNTPVTITVTFQVTPKVPKVEYKPHVGIALTYSSEYHSGGTSDTILADSFSYTNEAGTWTVSAEGNYVWDWSADSSPVYNVQQRPRAKIPTELISASVSPSLGTPVTPFFTFGITYKDADNTHSYVRVYIDGSAADMDYARGDWYAEGAVFSHTTVLSPGKHTYYFEASDISGLTTRFPETGTLSLEVPGWIVVGIIVGAVVIGSVTYLFIRRRRRITT